MVNVDLLIRNDRRETLLTWRQDELYRGWHIPAGSSDTRSEWRFASPKSRASSSARR